MMKKITKERAEDVGTKYSRFGKYHYKYESGHEGDMCSKLDSSPRKECLISIYFPASIRINH
jgi:hypothetical protein